MSGEPNGKTQVRVALSAADLPSTFDNFYVADIAEDVIQHRLERSLREDYGLTYGTTVYQQRQTPQERQWLLNIRFDTDPKRLDYAMEVLDTELLNVLNNPISEQEVAEAKLRLNAYYARQQQTNAGIEKSLYWTAILGMDYAQFDDYPQAIKAIRVDDVMAIARRWIQGRRVVAILQPKNNSKKKQ
jgi:predicted Zn-dependent peptidase